MQNRRICSFFLAMIMLCNMLVLPSAASGSSAGSTAHADQLAALGLFRGTGKGYELDAVPDRAQGLTMLIRLLGVEEDALQGSWTHPFTDVIAWSAPYVGYGYQNGLTTGVKANLFGGSRTLGARDYVTFLLRSLGYSDAEGQFAWQTSLDFAAEIGMMTPAAAAVLANATMNRGDMVDLSYAALTQKMENGKQTLAEKLVADGVFTRQTGRQAGVIDAAHWVYTYEKHQPPVVHEKRSISTASGTVQANVLTVDLTNPAVEVRAAMVNKRVGATAPFKDIVARSGALAAVNANFFDAGAAFQAPVGSVFSNGEPLYTMNGYTTMGITADGEIRWGRPSFAVWVKGENTTRQHWVGRSVNVDPGYHDEYYSVLYTPTFGTSVTPQCNGYAIEVRNNIVTAYKAYTPGMTMTIPQDGYLLLLGTALTTLYLYAPPAIGTEVTMETYLYTPDAEGYDPNGVVTAVAGAPRLVKDGKLCYETDANFGAEKFTVYATPRTAAGSTADGDLILVSTPSATVEQMRQVMLALGCTDAVNLDGGGSCGMYYNGTFYSTPGRELTTTLQIFVH